ncbi:hypothetical protein D3C73_1452590 [compost metagenome]
MESSSLDNFSRMIGTRSRVCVLEYFSAGRSWLALGIISNFNVNPPCSPVGATLRRRGLVEGSMFSDMSIEPNAGSQPHPGTVLQ